MVVKTNMSIARGSPLVVPSSDHSTSPSTRSSEGSLKLLMRMLARDGQESYEEENLPVQGVEDVCSIH